MSDDFSICAAVREDIPDILHLIKSLAEYENLSHEAVATCEDIEKAMFERETVWVFLAQADGKTVGMALYYETFSTFTGKRGIHLEDLFVEPEYRGKGIGMALLKTLARECVSRGCARLEWNCLNWNTPSMEFYRSIGATPLNPWTYFRLSGETLQSFASQDK